MKQLLFIFYLFINQNFDVNIDKTNNSNNILGKWVFEKTETIEEIKNNVYQVKTSGYIDEVNITFYTNNEGTILLPVDKEINFTWKSKNKNIIINCNDDEKLCNSINGKFKITYKQKSKTEELRLTNKKLTIVLNRKKD
jgi:hypothetical protein